MGYEFDGVVYDRLREMQEARRERYLELVSGGMSFTRAAEAAGVSKRTGKVWRNGRGRSSGRDERALVDWHRGDMEGPKKIGGHHLSRDERIAIADGLRAGGSIRSIAARLGGSPSTVGREIRSNAGPTGAYGPYRAQQLSTSRLRRPRARKIDNPRPRRAAQEKLDGHWSPEQISGWLRREFPDNDAVNACHETVYQAIYVQSKGRLRRDIEGKLRPGRSSRRPRPAGDGRKPRFRDPMVMTGGRPAEVEDRAVPGRWEGDPIAGAANRSAIGTPAERATRFTVPLRLPGGHGAEQVRGAIVRKMARPPELMPSSLTWDQGSGLARRKKIGAALGMQACFCDPRSPWRRGTNENTNGLLRRCFPKGADLSACPEDCLDAVAEELNDRPRKTLGFMKPSELFVKLIDESEDAA